ncbi:MAG: cytochrome c-type biogenesis protein [Hyphomonas sp.]|uniref:cytochrome c-type biogenesis protein n=1 Tax=Hyphomonas sp. TaxID=87 RepID=UPI0035297359
MKALILSLMIALAADIPLEDPAEEARAQALMREVRCVACENEPVSQSAAPIAEDMRARIREMILEGSSDQEVRDWFESRYGEFVLFRPKGQGLSGFLLWGGPFLLLLAGLLIGWRTVRNRPAAVRAEIESEEV